MQFDWVLVDGLAQGRGEDLATLRRFCGEAKAEGLAVLGDSIPDRNDPDLAGHMERLAEAGVSGFRCRHAHRLGAGAWSELFEGLRRQSPDLLFVGDAVGAALDEVLALEHAGFDLLFNSACWWDFNSPWALDQYDLLRRFVRTVTFPESPYGPRLVDTLGGLSPELLEAAYRSRYLFAGAFSAGVLMPMGFECAATGRIAGDWDAARQAAPFDLSTFVTEVNALKMRCRRSRSRAG
jgi:starch synthase (maltosyl-transferring)